MNDNICLAEFEKLARQLGVEIRYTAGGPSGLCTIKGERVLFLDKTLDRRDKIDVFVHEFKTLDLEGFFVVPVIRRLLGLDNESAEW